MTGLTDYKEFHDEYNEKLENMLEYIIKYKHEHARTQVIID